MFKIRFRSFVNLNWTMFSGAKAGKISLILDSETLCTNPGSGFNVPAYIYVPRALVEDYKVATNWSAYADQFRALEDYTVDGTISGDLDETKI